jgi:hypothetical protein
MIGKLSYGNRFGGLSGYLTKDQERVGEIEYRNTFSSDPRQAAAEMQDLVHDKLISERSSQLEKPTMHLSLSFHKNDQVSHQKMFEIMDKTLDDLGLKNHQAMLVIHTDTDHPHIHAMVNRVDPENHKVWERDYDWPRLHSALRDREKEYHLTEVNMPDKSNGKAPSLGEIKAAQKEQDFAREIGLDQLNKKTVKDETIIAKGRELHPELMKAKSFAEFDNILAREGLYLEAKGRGAVISDGSYKVKASSVSRDFGIQKLEQRFGQRLKDYLAERDKLLSQVDNTKVKEAFNDLAISGSKERGRQSIYAQLSTAEHHLKQSREFLEAHSKHTNGLSTGMNEIYENGFGAFKRLRERIAEVGSGRALQEFRDNPKRFGALNKEFRKGIVNLGDLQTKVELHWKGLTGLKKRFPQMANKTLDQVRDIHRQNGDRLDDLKSQLSGVAGKPGGSLAGAQQNFKNAAMNVLQKAGVVQKSEAAAHMEKGVIATLSLAKDVATMVSNPKAAVSHMIKKLAVKALKATIQQAKQRGMGL